MTIAETRAAEDVVGTAISSMGSANGSPTRIPVYRYTSPDFAKVEIEKVFAKAWLVACSVDHSSPGPAWPARRGGTMSAIRRPGPVLCAGRVGLLQF